MYNQVLNFIKAKPFFIAAPILILMFILLLTSCSSTAIPEGHYVYVKDTSTNNDPAAMFGTRLAWLTVAGTGNSFTVKGNTITNNMGFETAYTIESGHLKIIAAAAGRAVTFSYERKGDYIYIDGIEYVLESSKQANATLASQLPPDNKETTPPSVAANNSVVTEQPPEPEPAFLDLNLPIIAKENVLSLNRYQGYRITADSVLQKNNSSREWQWTDIDTDVRSIEYAGATVLYIKNDNSLWGFGSNRNGMLGDGTGVDSETPIKILDDVARVANFVNSNPNDSGFRAVKTDKTIWKWGNNTDYAPVLVADDMINCFYNYTQALLHASNGLIMSSFDNSILDKPGVPVYQAYVTFGYSCWIDQDRTLWSWSNAGTSNATDVKISEDVDRFYFNNHHLFIIKSDGSLWGLGDNTAGQLGDGTKVPRKEEAVKIADGVEWAGTYKFLKTNGELWTWDSNKPTPERVATNVAEVYDNALLLKNGRYVSDFKKWVTADSTAKRGYEIEGFKIPETKVFP
ncbi:MAG: hypothetical protein FWH05_04580 [Oscillospiraceae bacterium]|nr:hypothetical protein [Oscillospiraceae bacterium]